MAYSKIGGLPTIGFGTCRLILASLVAASHLWSNMVQGYAAYAVWAFFVLSGFLMTLVLTTKYGFDRPGIRAYAFNRFMRIFPLYWIAALMGLATLWYYGRYGIDLRPINGEFYMPSGLREWSYAITLFPGIQRGGLPVAVSNALGIEVGFYMLMPFLARSKSTAWFAFILAIILNLKLGIVGESFGDRYATFLPCMLPFAAGALACLYREKLSKFNMPITSLIVWLVHGGLWLYLPGYPWTWGLYISMILSVWMVVSLHKQKSNRVDKLLGDMSYPVYLIHTIVAAWFVCSCGFDRPFGFFLQAFAATLLLSLLIVFVIDRPLSRLKIKAPGVKPVSDHISPM